MSQSVSKSIRVQMAPETQNFLESLAEELGLTYNLKGSISQLCQKIALGELKVTRNEIQLSDKIYQNLENSYLTKIRFLTLLNLKGILSVFSKEVFESDGNIYKIDVVHKNHYLGYLECILYISKEKSKELVSKLTKTSIEKIENFNNKDEILKAMEELGYPSNSGESEEIKNALWNQRKSEKLFRELSFTFGIKAIAENKPGKLSAISNIISEEKILISDVKLNTTKGFDKVEIDIFLELRPSFLNKNDEVIDFEKIEQVIKKIQKNLNIKANKMGLELLKTLH